MVEYRRITHLYIFSPVYIQEGKTDRKPAYSERTVRPVSGEYIHVPPPVLRCTEKKIGSTDQYNCHPPYRSYRSRRLVSDPSSHHPAYRGHRPDENRIYRCTHDTEPGGSTAKRERASGNRRQTYGNGVETGTANGGSWSSTGMGRTA